MFLGMQDFDFCPNLIKFYPNFTYFTQILPNLPKFYPNLPKFYPNCPNFAQIGLNFAQILLKHLLEDSCIPRSNATDFTASIIECNRDGTSIFLSIKEQVRFNAFFRRHLFYNQMNNM